MPATVQTLFGVEEVDDAPPDLMPGEGPPICLYCGRKYPGENGVCGYCRPRHYRRLDLIERVNCVDPAKVPGIRVCRAGVE